MGNMLTPHDPKPIRTSLSRTDTSGPGVRGAGGAALLFTLVASASCSMMESLVDCCGELAVRFMASFAIRSSSLRELASSSAISPFDARVRLGGVLDVIFDDFV